MILNNEGKKEFIKSDFHQYVDITLTLDTSGTNITQFANFILPLFTIQETLPILKFFNSNYNNVIFTSQDNKHIYRYEYYQEHYFIRIYPFTLNIRMHIVPKKYDASNSLTDPILLFKDRDVEIDENNFRSTSKYTRSTSGNPINSSYSGSSGDNEYFMYKFDIRDKTRNLNSLQIDTKYQYTQTSGDNLRHYTGSLNESTRDGTPLDEDQLTQYQSTIIDANTTADDYTNRLCILQRDITDKPIYENEDAIRYIGNGRTDNEHIYANQYYKTLKYMNDDLYSFEWYRGMTGNWDGLTLKGHWEEVDW